MIPGWIDDDEWAHMQLVIPIVCVDIVCLQYFPHTSNIKAIGLILRDTPHQGQRWCLVGGRLRYRETIATAITRQLHDTLGPDSIFTVSANQQPVHVAQYLPSPTEGFPHDPRKHAVALTYALEVGGLLQAQNEALTYQWFPPDSMPSSDEFGFEQDRVVEQCLTLLSMHSIDTPRHRTRTD